MKVLSLFSGIGAFEKALTNMGVPYELVAYCEIDKYASRSYAAIHGVSEEKNLGDITKVEEKQLPKDIDLLTYGFPCQDISIAGRQKGFTNEDGTRTRSGLFFEALRIIEESQPRVAIAENVKNLTGKKFAGQFQTVLETLEAAGYNNYWKVLNLKDYGIPQNRERVFIVSIRKDIDNGQFRFPDGFPLTLRLKDVLEEEVDEKYFMDTSAIEKIRNSSFTQERNRIQFGDVCGTLRARDYKGAPCVPLGVTTTERVLAVGNVNPSGHGMNGNVISEEGLSSTLTTNKGEGLKILVSAEPQVRQIGNCCPTRTRDNPNQGRIYDTDGIAPALNCMGGGNRQPFVMEPNVLTAKRTEYGKAIRKAYEAGEIQESRHNMTEMVPRTDGVANTLTTVLKDNYVAVAIRGRYTEDGRTEQVLEESDREYANTITTVQKDSLVSDKLRIRKLTPKECFRLMGFDDADYEKAAAVNSNTQLYKQAGNSIGVPVVQGIMENLFACGIFDEKAWVL